MIVDSDVSLLESRLGPAAGFCRWQRRLLAECLSLGELWRERYILRSRVIRGRRMRGMWVVVENYEEVYADCPNPLPKGTEGYLCAECVKGET
jgi:hypothetical protein